MARLPPIVGIAVEAPKSLAAEASSVAAYAQKHLSLSSATLPDEYYYSSVILCVIDAIYSIGIRYGGVRAVVSRYCARFGLTPYRADRSKLPSTSEQPSIADLCGQFASLGSEAMAATVFCNRHRTSTRGGILKAEAVGRFASILRKHGVNHLQGAVPQKLPALLEEQIRSIPGQGSGISLGYFFMLAGSDELVKPDRMIQRFLASALDRAVGIAEAQPLVSAAARILKTSQSQITPRLLDYKIWEYQRAPREEVGKRRCRSL
jgi:hypothetical protein